MEFIEIRWVEKQLSVIGVIRSIWTIWMNELMCHSRATSVQDLRAGCEGLREEAGTLGDDPGGEVAGVGAPVGGIRGLEGGKGR